MLFGFFLRIVVLNIPIDSRPCVSGCIDTRVLQQQTPQTLNCEELQTSFVLQRRRVTKNRSKSCSLQLYT